MDRSKIRKRTPKEAENQSLRAMASRSPQERLNRVCRLKRMLHRLYKGDLNHQKKMERKLQYHQLSSVKKVYP